MTTAHEKLAASLDALRELQQDGDRVFRSRQLKRADRERLVKNGFRQEVMRGWLISSSPEAAVRGDSTAWFASFGAEGRPGSLAVRVHSPVSGREWTDRPFRDEQLVRVRWLSLDDRPRRGA
jgi:hypothetical protein